jgi:two-component system chemotaxis sensor kinase CheA
MSDFIHDDPSFYEDFLVEAQEHFEQIEQNFLTLEESPGNLDILNGIFRSVHTIKGASGFLGLDAIQSLSHIGENILDELRKGRMSVTPDVMETLFQTVDVLKVLVNDVGVSLRRQGEQVNPDTTDIKRRLEALKDNAGVSTATSAPSSSGPKKASISFPDALASLPQDLKSKIAVAVEGGNTVICLKIKLLQGIVGTPFNPTTTFSLMELIGESVLAEKLPLDPKVCEPWRTEQ